MQDQRSASQILFGLLPEQTVDLQGGIWKVKEWTNPIREAIDDDSLRRELCRLASPWQAAGLDGGFVGELRSGHEIKVYSLNRENGVHVQPFPKLWMCRACNRLRKTPTAPCACGQRRFGQLPFVGYHDGCGTIEEPFIRGCPQHDDVKVVLPGTMSAGEIEFRCPTCNNLLRKGFGFPNCNCGSGKLTFNVHRAASVFTPRTLVMVNSPSQVRVKKLADAGGQARALGWVLDGLVSQNIEDVGLTREALLRQLTGGGISAEVAQSMVALAVTSGNVSADIGELDVSNERREAASAEAVTIALALSDSRTRLADLAAGVNASSELATLYLDAYPPALADSGLDAVELIDQFPVLTGNFGYTRGSSTPGASRLVPFREQRGGAYVVYADVGSTEALFFRLNPTKVARWLERRGHHLRPWSDDRTARIAIVAEAEIPAPGTRPIAGVGTDLLRLVHSFSHRFIRRAAVLAGIEQTSLSELLVPLHLGFFIYAAARGDFVLGGLQAVFETELHSLLHVATRGDHRCPLDPGCTRAGGACVACLHVGEPSCRYFNGYLDRRTLEGGDGFLAP